MKNINLLLPNPLLIYHEKFSPRIAGLQKIEIESVIYFIRNYNMSYRWTTLFFQASSVNTRKHKNENA